MTIGEIKIEALKIMFIDDEELYIDNMSEYYKNERYAGFLRKMTGSINRCLSDIEMKKAMPSHTYIVPYELSRTPIIRLHIPNLYSVERIVYENHGTGEYDGDCSFYTEGKTIVIFNNHGTDKNADSGFNFDDLGKVSSNDCSGHYMVVYKPKTIRLKPENKDDEDIYLPENIASLIPYYIKGDLYREDQPNEAGEARNWYENGITQAAMSERSANEHKQNGVVTVFKI